ncbi:MAG: GyrI-like domain-containing protein [Myxococcota bacterium]
MPTADDVRLDTDTERRLIGRRRTMTMAEAPTICPKMWMEFMPTAPHHRKLEPVSYGVNVNFDHDAGTFEYMVALEVADFDENDGYDRLVVPAGPYAVVTHEGPASNIGQTYQFMFGDWFPKSGKQMAPRPNFERYGPGYNAEKGEGDTEIWFPVAQ